MASFALRPSLIAPITKASPTLSARPRPNGHCGSVAPSWERSVTKAIGVRPYTVRDGDMAYSIGSKRGMSVDELQVLNPQMDLNKIHVGDTILVPAKLSSRDREILEGMGKGTRTYPVRSGESIDQILSKRNISREDCQKLNPSVDLDHLKGGQQILLPTGKFTVREQEMLEGMGIAPAEFFGLTIGSELGLAGLIGAFVLAGVFIYRAVSSGGDEDDE